MRYFDVKELKPILFKDGIYTGQVKNGTPNGKGRYSYNNGETYDGQFVNGVKEGNGSLKLENGICLTGEFHDGQLNGKVKIYYSNDTYYEGFLINGKKQGHGYIKNAINDSIILEGKWIQDKKQGEFVKMDYNIKIFEYYDDDVLIGSSNYQNKEIIKNGHFKPSIANSLYNGEVNDYGLPNGYGMIKDENGNSYIGQFINGLKDGFGEECYSNGDRYEGNFARGKRAGLGVYYYSNGQIYIGKFNDNTREGDFKVINSDNSILYCQFVNDLREGCGSLIMENGEAYDVKFSNDKLIEKQKVNKKSLTTNKEMKQEDKRLFARRIVYDSCTVQGNIWQTMAEAKDTSMIIPKNEICGDVMILFDSGAYYEGTILNGKFYGTGTYKSADRKIVYQGQFVNNKFDGVGELIEGQQVYAGYFSNGMKNGKGSIYTVDGELIETGRYRDGRFIGKLEDSVEQKREL